jgi:hypothetical protein
MSSDDCDCFSCGKRPHSPFSHDRPSWKYNDFASSGRGRLRFFDLDGVGAVASDEKNCQNVRFFFPQTL